MDIREILQQRIAEHNQKLADLKQAVNDVPVVAESNEPEQAEPTKQAKVCEACENEVEKLTTYKTMQFCDTCLAKEKDAEKVLAEQAEDRVRESREIVVRELTLRKLSPDEVIQSRPDYFNAEAQSHIDLMKEIEADATIDNKYYAIAQRMKIRLEHLQSKLMEVREHELRLASEERAVHVTLNHLANKLREEEKERLKLQDINYKPSQVVVKPKKEKGPAKPSVSNNELTEKCNAEKVPAAVIKVLMERNKYSIERAITEYRTMIAANTNKQ